eukprot:5459152-Amphidinium_carterae.1
MNVRDGYAALATTPWVCRICRVSCVWMTSVLLLLLILLHDVFIDLVSWMEAVHHIGRIGVLRKRQRTQ